MAEYHFPETFQNVVNHFKRLPGVGVRGAERMVFSILKWSEEDLADFSSNALDLQRKLTSCPECGNLAEEGQRCSICSTPSRDQSLICVVESPSQIPTLEKSSLYKGVYHVLGGKLSPLSGVNAEDLRIDELVERVNKKKVEELILALSPDVEGQATAAYIINALKEKPVRVTRLARGLPAGSDIGYADSATIAAAFTGRVAAE